MYESTTDLSLRQTHILDSNSKNAWWLFEVTYGETTYYWSDFSSKTYNGHTYTFKIRDFSPINIGYAGGDYGMVAPSEFWTEIDNAGNSLSASDLTSATLTLRLIMSANLAVQPSGGDATIESGVTLDNSHDDVQEDQIRAWRFNATHVSPTGLQSLKVQWEPFHLKYLRQDWPTGKLAHDEFPDDTGMDDTYCIPKIYGTAYIPLRSVYKTDKRYYLLGASGVTYTVSEVRAPRDWSDQTWASGSYTFTDDTIAGRSTTNYKASRFLIADSDNDGTPDANGLFYQGSRFLDILAKFSASDTASMTAPGNVIENFLEALGVPSAEINDTAKASANTTYSSRGITWAGGYWYKQDSEKVLADMLTQCDTDLVVRDTLILRPRDNTPKLTIETNLMLVDGSDNDTYRCYPVNQQDYRDSCHAAYRPSGEPMDSLLRIIVPADTATSYPSDHTYDMPLVHDSQVVQKLGTLAAQRKFNRLYEITWMADPKILQLEVGDVFTLAHANYGGPVRVLITGMSISSELDIKVKGTIFSTNLKSWSDLSPGAVTPATDDSTSVYSPVYQGPRNDTPADRANNITENLYVEQGGDVIMAGGSTGNPSLIRFTDDDVPGEIRFEQADDSTCYWNMLKKGTYDALYIGPSEALEDDSIELSLYIGQGGDGGLTRNIYLRSTACVYITPGTSVKESYVMTGNVTDGIAAYIVQQPTYTHDTENSWTVTRHNYITLYNPVTSATGGGSITISNACVFKFDAAAGTHKAVDAGSTKSSPGTVNAWLKVNINGTIYYIPAYTSKTS